MRWVLVAAVACLAGGCREDTYRVNMRVGEADVTREVDVKSDVQGPVAEDEQKRFEGEIGPLRRVYGKAGVDERGHVAFQGSFTTRTPDDIGGFGVVARIRSTLGEVVYYGERFRGYDDIVAANGRRGGEVDRLIDAMVQWSRAEFAGKAGGEEIAKALDSAIRADAQNVSMWVWLSRGAPAAESIVPQYREEVQKSVAPEVDPLVRVELFLIEHGYLDAEELLKRDRPQASDVTEVRLPETPGDEWRTFVRMVAHKMTASGHADSVALLSSWGMATSLSSFVGGHLARPGAGEDRVRDFAEESEAVMLAYVPTTIGLMLTNYDELDVTLDIGGSVVRGGGVEVAPGTVEWKTVMAANRGEQSAASTVVGAVSARPYEAAQRRALGGVVLTGENLAEYCGLLYSLREEQRASWEEALSVSGGRADRGRLKSAAKKAGIEENTRNRLLELLWMP